MSLKKTAFFVEGFTEQIFVSKLLSEVFGTKEIEVSVKEVKGSLKSGISYTEIQTSTITDETKYFILIYNCGGDSSIKSYIIDQRKSLIKSGYTKIIGLRDLYPDFQRNDLKKLKKYMDYGIPQKGIPVKFVLSVMEIEAWFIAEESHYLKIDNNLTNEIITDAFGFSIDNYNTELIDEPAKMLNSIYQLVGKSYRKKTDSITRTVSSLDYSNIYINVKERIKSMDDLLVEIEDIFI